MPRLSCSVSNCAHNTDMCCSLNHVEIDGAGAHRADSTCCQDFVESSGATNCAGCANPTVDVGCEATNCAHNCDCKCQAASIDVSGMGATNCAMTQCSSFCSQ